MKVKPLVKCPLFHGSCDFLLNQHDGCIEEKSFSNVKHMFICLAT